MAQNLIEKIAQKYAVGLSEKMETHSGDYISIKPAHILTHDNTGAVMNKFAQLGMKKMANPRQPMFALDHNVQDKSEANLQKYQRIEDFAGKMGVDFYPAGRGIGHQIMCEEGYAWPGTMVVASDSHANMYGGLGALGTPIVRTDAAAIWATGRTWWQVPPVATVELRGKLLPGVTGKDIIITLCGLFNEDEVLNHALEFTGDGIAELSIDQRLAIANMSTEWGALAGVFPIDETTIKWLESRINFIQTRGLAGVPSDIDGNGQHPRMNPHRLAELQANIPVADENARYNREIILNLETVCPHISGPDNVKTMTSIFKAEQENIRINKAYLVSCVNSRVEDLAAAAKVVTGQKVADHVEFYIAAASSEVLAESEKRGDWQTLLDAGAIPLPPGCGPCIGLGIGLLGENEVGISATNRNFKGRMGAKSSKAYLASPAVVAASAIAGKITAPIKFDEVRPNGASGENIDGSEEIKSVKIIPGFPAIMEGGIVWCHQNNLNTDGIYPGKYTYLDDFTPAQQAEVTMENYDSEFVKIAKKSDILIGGYNFGSGSSREQAATCLKYFGIQLVIAGSFSETYKRNAINNGFLVIEAPKLVEDLQSQFGTDKPTVATGWKLLIDFEKAKLFVNDKEYGFNAVGEAAQELILVGGLEAWVKRQ